LVLKQGLYNRLLRFPQQFIQEGEHYLLIDKELTDWAGKETKIKEHDICMSDIIAVDICDYKDSSEHPLFPEAEEKNHGDKDT
jgi:hypothetical protein